MKFKHVIRRLVNVLDLLILIHFVQSVFIVFQILYWKGVDSMLQQWLVYLMSAMV
jgi:hypothetical protein